MVRTGFDTRRRQVVLSKTAMLFLCLGPGATFSAAAGETPALLSEKPPQMAATTQFDAGPSTIQPGLNISYKLVADAANATADRFAGPHSGTTRLGCTPAQVGTSVKVALPNGCADFDWHVNAERNGTITAKRDGDGIAIAVPVKFAGNGSFRGDIAKAAQMTNKDFNGTFVVTISGAVGVDKSFCPKLDRAVTHFTWVTPPEIDVMERKCLDAGNGLKACIGPWKFPVGSMLTEQINRSLASQVGEINAKIPCNDIRNQLKTVWKPWSLPVTLPNAPAYYVNVVPKSLSIPGIVANDDSIALAARLDVATSVSDSKLPDSPRAELPDNTPLESQGAKFALAVPLAVPYALLASVPDGGIVGKPLRAGKGSAITPTGMEFFPSNDRLAVGVTFRADAPRKFAGQTATVWFTATPTVESSGHLIRLGNVTMTRKLDGPLWALGPAIGVLPPAIGKTYSYDLSPLVHDAQTKIDRTLADPKNVAAAGIKVSNDDLRLGRTALLANAFVVEGLFDADVAVTLQEPH